MKRLTELTSFSKEKANRSNRMKLGKEIPEGGVNLGYVHTGGLKIDDSISIVDTSYVTDNIVPLDQVETIAMANEQGELEFVNYVDKVNVIPRDPGNVFPNERVAVTNEFFEGQIQTNSALYFCNVIKYHYDNKKDIPDQNGFYKMKRYTGNQIRVTDELGNTISDSEKVAIYVKAIEANPNIYEMYIFTNKDAKDKTYRVRYNHIDAVTTNDLITSVQDKVELYVNHSNSRIIKKEVIDETTGDVTMEDFTQYFMETGKLRTVNTESVFQQISKVDLIIESTKDNPKKVYSIDEHENGKGYKILVPSKTEYDSRPTKEFGYSVTATYKDKDTGKLQTKSTGIITDTLMHPDSLINDELSTYTSGSKMIGIPRGNQVMNAAEMINMSLPFGTAKIPDNAKFEIRDTMTDRVYSQVHHPDNPDIISDISDAKYAQAKAQSIQIKTWPLGNKATIALEEYAQSGTFSIIPERQRVRWPFEFNIEGTGIIEKKPDVPLDWRLCAEVAFNKYKTPKKLDLHKYNKWAGIGKRKDGTPARDDYVYEYNEDIGRVCLQFQNQTSHDLTGIYQTKENYDTRVKVSRMAAMNPYSPVEDEVKYIIDPMNAADYTFSTKVRMNHKDDDVIGVIFRVQGDKNFYMFAWEKEQRSYLGGGTINDEPDEDSNTDPDYLPTDTPEEEEIYQNGQEIPEDDFPQISQAVATTLPVAQIGYRYLLDERGAVHVTYSPNDPATDLNVTSQEEYLNNSGMGRNHKRIYKVTPGGGGFAKDLTGCSFEDITDTSASFFNTHTGQSGWTQGMSYKITVDVKGDEFKIYIDTNTSEDSDSKGTLSCQAKDSTYTEGSYGVVTLSQWDTFWWDMEFMPVEYKTICSPWRTTIIESEDKLKLSNYSAGAFMSRFINQYRDTLYKECDYRVIKYIPSDAGNLGKIDVDLDKFHYIWFTPNPDVIKMTRVMWLASEQGLDIKGKGTVSFNPDGTFDVQYSPKRIKQKIPSTVKNFGWSEPTVPNGPDVKVMLFAQEDIRVEVKTPEISLIGQAKVIDNGFEVFHKDGLKKAYELDLDNLYEDFKIPSFVPRSEILLRIERGVYDFTRTDIEKPETTDINNKINYRFRVMRNGNVHMPVDQFPQWLGVNRLRLDQVTNEEGRIESGVEIDVVGWTHHTNYKAIPLYAVRSLDERRVQLAQPHVEPSKITSRAWYPRIKNGHFMKRLRLPYYEPGDGSLNMKPAIYKRYPMLDGMVLNEDHVVEVDAEYAIPEYGKQEFFNDKQILVSKEEPTIINQNTVQVINQNIVLVDDHEREANKVWVVRNNIEKELRIKDIDRTKGIFYLHDDIIEGDHVFTRYLYKEDYYTYKGFLRENIKYMPIETNLDVDISFEADFKAEIDYEEDVIETATVNWPSEWCIDGSSLVSTSNKIIFLYGDYLTASPDELADKSSFINILKSIVPNVVMANKQNIDSINIDIANDFLFVADMTGIQDIVRPLIAGGMRGFVCGEHEGVIPWVASFNDLFAGKVNISQRAAGVATNYLIETPDFPGLSQYRITVSACGQLDLEGDYFKPLLQTNDGKNMIAYHKDESTGQTIVITGDSNMFDNSSITDESMKNFLETIIKQMIRIPSDPLNIKITSEKKIIRQRIFLNKTYNLMGTNAYEMDVAYTAGVTNMDIQELIRLASESGDTGVYNKTKGASNTVTIEFMSEFHTLNTLTFIIKAGDCEGTIVAPPIPDPDPEQPNPDPEPQPEPEPVYTTLLMSAVPYINPWYYDGKATTQYVREGTFYFYLGGDYIDLEGTAAEAAAEAQHVFEQDGLFDKFKAQALLYKQDFKVITAFTIGSINFDVEKDFITTTMLRYTDSNNVRATAAFAKLKSLIDSNMHCLLLGEREVLGDAGARGIEYIASKYNVGIDQHADGNQINPFIETPEFPGIGTHTIKGGGMGGVIAPSTFTKLVMLDLLPLITYYKNSQTKEFITVTGDSNIIMGPLVANDEEGFNIWMKGMLSTLKTIHEPTADITVSIANNLPITKVRVFVNKPWAASGAGSYEKPYTIPASMPHQNDATVVSASHSIKDLIKEANESGQTGAYDKTPNATNEVTIEMIIDEAYRTHVTISIKEGVN